MCCCCVVSASRSDLISSAVVTVATLVFVRVETATLFFLVLVGVDAVLLADCAIRATENRGIHKYRRNFICVPLLFSLFNYLFLLSVRNCQPHVLEKSFRVIANNNI